MLLFSGHLHIVMLPASDENPKSPRVGEPMRNGGVKKNFDCRIEHMLNFLFEQLSRHYQI